MRGPVVRICILCMLAILLGGAAYAAVITDSETINLTPTDWNQVIYLEKFHGDIARLQSVVIKLSSTAETEIGYENRATNQASITLNWTATVTMQKNGASILSVAPTYSGTVTPSAYDGNFNWTGSSGNIFTVSDTKSNQIVLNSGFGDYVGDGTFELNILAEAVSQTIGTGRVASYYLTDAGVTATVEYTTLPEPASFVALATGLIGIAGVGTRRRK